ncbi:MAG: PD-(D/E)XK nuclease family protein [Micrococcales bacterium]
MTQAKFLATPQFQPAAQSLAGVQVAVSTAPASGVLLVFGAPGTGKTTALIGRFIQLVRSGISPSEILVLAATRDSAALLRDSLALELQSATEGPLARTATSLAFALIRQEALAAGRPLPQLISGAKQDSLISALLQEAQENGQTGLWPSHISETTRSLKGFRAELRDLLAVCQEWGVSAQRLRDLGEDSLRGASKQPQWIAAAQIFENYERLLAQPEFENQFDSPSLLQSAISLLEANPKNQLVGLKAILIDDAQELTPTVAKLIRTLARQSGAGVSLFGDPDSTTLGFRGADPMLMTQLARSLAGSEQPLNFYLDRQVQHSEFATVTGESSTSPEQKSVAVLSKISALIPPAGAGQQRKSLGASNIRVQVLSSKFAEVAWLARQLRELHLYQGVPWQDMAVVARSRGALQDLELGLAAESVPVRIRGAQSALRDEFAANQLLQVARLALSDQPLSPEDAVFLLTSVFCGLDNLSLRRLRRALRAEELAGDGTRNTNELLVELFENADYLATIKGSEARTAKLFIRNFLAAKEVANDSAKTIEDLLWQIWDKARPNQGPRLQEVWVEWSRGLSEVAVQANRNLDAVVALFATANRYVERSPGSSMSDFIAQQLDQNLPEDNLVISDRGRNTVDLVTPSGLVGRRYQVVATPQLIEGVWPNLKPRSSLLGAGLLLAQLQNRVDPSGQPLRTELADELRMFYKSLGASTGLVLVSSFDQEEAQLSQFVMLAAGTIPKTTDFRSSALTLRGLSGSLRRRLALSTEPTEQVAFAAGLAQLSEAGVPGAHPDEWYGVAPLSTTEPLFDFTVDQDTEDAGELITIRPSQLEDFVKCPLHWFLNNHGAGTSDFSANLGTLIHKALELSKTGTQEEIWQHVESKWHTLSFEADWIEQSQKRNARKMVANLVTYLTDSQANGNRVLAVEQGFDFRFGKAQIIGKVDRIEQTPAGNLVIVDLKTGKRTFTAEEAKNHAQLGLYQLAFQNGAFKDLKVPHGNTKLDGAKLLLVAGDKPRTADQPSIQDDPVLANYFEQLLQDAANGMAMPNKVFVAKVASHCESDNEYGSCSLHLTRAVSYAG